ncbi:12483_t:CDS:2, partial [Dentiscutata erythropus]
DQLTPSSIILCFSTCHIPPDASIEKSDICHEKEEDQLTPTSFILCSSTRHISIGCKCFHECNTCKWCLAAHKSKALEAEGPHRT